MINNSMIYSKDNLPSVSELFLLHRIISSASCNNSVREIMVDVELVAKIDQVSDVLQFFKGNPDALNGGLGSMSLTKLNSILPFINIEPDVIRQVNTILETTPLLSHRQ